MIELSLVRHAFAGRRVLDDISLTLAERRIGIIGPNGGGKSTFARLLNGLLIPDAGRVVVDGADTREKLKEVRHKVGFVFQNPDNQIVMPTVAEDLAFGLKNIGLAGRDLDRRLEAALLDFNLAGLGEMPAHRLSGGQKQLLALAGVVAMQPAYLVLDEPTTLLDLRNSRMIGACIAALPQVVVLVSHDLDAFTGFERVLVIDGGRVVADDEPAAAIRFYRRLAA